MCDRGRRYRRFRGQCAVLRIATRLAVLREDKQGLDLSRATLNAVLKYPWQARDKGGRGAGKKFGVYDDDIDCFRWARDGMNFARGQRSLEAEIMDWADDITYAVHGVEDFYRAGLIPTSQLGRASDQDMDALASLVKRYWEPKFGPAPPDPDLEKAAEVALAMLPRVQPFRGTRNARSALRQGTSALIHRFTKATRVGRDGLEIDYSVAVEVSLLKQLTRHFVIRNAVLATQQVGQKRIVKDRRIAQRAGLQTRCSPHILRHTFARAFLTNGGDVFALQRILGHSPASLDITQRYVELLDEDLREVHRRASPMDQWRSR